MNLFYERKKFAQNYNFRTSEMYTSLAKRPHKRFSSVTICFDCIVTLQQLNEASLSFKNSTTIL